MLEVLPGKVYDKHLMTNNQPLTLIYCMESEKSTYRQISHISLTKSQNFDVSRLVLQLSLPNQSKPGVKSRMKM